MSASDHASPICVMITESRGEGSVNNFRWSLYGVCGCGTFFYPLTTASDPGGQLSCDMGPGCPPPFPPFPHLVPRAQSRRCAGAAAAPAPQPRLKATGLILNLLALAFSLGRTRLICSHKGPLFFHPPVPSADRPAAELLLALHSSCGACC